MNSIGCLRPRVCWIGWDSVGRTHVFFWPFGFRGSDLKLYCLLPPRDVSLTIHGEVRCGEGHESQDTRTRDGGLKLCGDEGLSFGELRLATTTVSGGGVIGEVHSLTLKDENPKSGLYWLCLAMDLLKALIFLGGVAFGGVGLLVLFW